MWTTAEIIFSSPYRSAKKRVQSTKNCCCSCGDSLPTLAERKTRYCIVIKAENKTAQAVKQAVIKTLGKYPEGTVKTITTDNGSEFAKWQEIERELKTNVYFADPYCAWQKGTNENLNGLLRKFYPKGRNLARVSAKTLAQNVAKINNRPKKVLNFQTPADLFEQELQKVLHLT